MQKQAGASIWLRAVPGAIALLLGTVALAGPPAIATRTLIAPPPAITHTTPSPAPVQPSPLVTSPVYSIGNPTDEEQLWLEMVNYERANPQAEAEILESTTDADVLEAYSYFGVDLSALASQFSTITAAPPLSMNAELLAAATGHSQDMLTNGFQGHNGSDGSTFEQRISAQGYTASTEGENVYAFATSVFDGNAAYEVDWGDNPPTGMQSPPGHRENDHDASYAEVGIGVVDGTNTVSGTEYGPLTCTMDFGTQSTYTPFVTGVIYYDLNGNGQYDIGEGLGGVMVLVTGASYSGSSANSGGYSVPISAKGAQTVTFSMSGTAGQQVTTTLTGTSNVQVDLKLTYPPPVISGSANPQVNEDNIYQFTVVPGASGYQFKSSELLPFTTVETGKTGTADFIVTTTGAYNVIASDEPYDGAASFHLAHVTPDEQSLELSFALLPGAASSLQFESLLGWATTSEVASAQISTDGGATWQTVWSEVGTNTSGDSSFSSQSISLSQYAGEEIMVQFVYDTNGGSYYDESSTGVGFYVDDIQVTDASELSNTTLAAATSGTTTFDFVPPAAATYALAVRPQAVSRFFPYGPDMIVTATGSGGGQPAAVTGTATSVSATSAILNGSVNPGAASTSAFFEWGLDTSYGHSTSPMAVGSGTNAVAVNATISPLLSGTTYYYRMTGSNGNGVSYGEPESFTTMPTIAFNQLKGKYEGVIVTGTGVDGVPGIITISIASKGTFSASGKVGAKSFKFAGKFNATGGASMTIGKVSVDLQLEIGPPGMVTGTVAVGGVTGDVELGPVVTSTAATACTLRLPALSGTGLPAGNGYGTLTLHAKTGAASFSGKLGDGTAFTFGSSIVANGTNAPVIPVFFPLYGGKGYITGELTRETTVNGDIDGLLNWIKPPTAGAFFPEAFSTQAEMYGTIYLKPKTGVPVIPLTSGTVSFTAGDLLNPPVQNAVTLETNNKITVTGSDTDKFKMTIRASNGLFSGSFEDPDTHKIILFNGALFQGGFNFGVGVFKGKNDPGAVEFQ